MAKNIIDLTHPFDDSTPPFPGNPPVEVGILAAIPENHPAGKPGYVNSCTFKTCVHTGTHMDAPFHFYRNHPTIDRIPLDRCMGRALLIGLSDIAPNAEITPADLHPYQEQISEIRRVVLNTGWAIHWTKEMFFTDFPVITTEAAQFLVDCGTELIGIDTPSIDKAPNESHFIVLGNDTLIIENLTNLDLIEEDVFHLIALPLKITGRDGSPVRVAAVLE